MIKALVKPETKPAVQFPVNSLNNISMISPYNKQLLVVAPSHIDVKPVMRIISGKLQNINYTIYPTQELAEEAYEQDRDNVAAGIIFSYLPSEGNGSSVLTYAIRMSCESSPDTGTIFRQALDQGKRYSMQLIDIL